MMSSNISLGYFSLPEVWISPELKKRKEKIVVVSSFGYSSNEANGYKSSAMELMLGNNILKRDSMPSISVNPNTLADVEGYFDPQNNVVYLHLRGSFDASILLTYFEKLSKQLQEKGFLIVWSELKFQYARSLFLLFCMSHILLLCHPSHIFDITCIHLFQTLDMVRTKANTHMHDILRTVPGVSKDWQVNARLCSPRVLFLFSLKLIPTHVLKEALELNQQGTKADQTRNNPIRKMELDLEYQIYRLLRKSRVITNISANSLFALPNNQPFVYMLEDHHESTRDNSLVTDALVEMCVAQDPLVTNFNKMFLDYQSKIPGGHKMERKGLSGSLQTEIVSITSLSDPTQADALSNTLLSTVAAERKRNLDHSFQNFLRQHIDEALNRGFDDNVGRNAGSVFFEIPKANVWFDAFKKMHSFLIMDSDQKNKVVSYLKSVLETDIRFSDARCAKVLPLAIATYKDGLPSHYSQAEHQSKLTVAMNILTSQARGPMYEKYVVNLEEACEAHWKDGRVGCETLSFTGNICQQPKHRDSTDEDSVLPTLSHSSGVVYVSYCNCGHTKAQIEDPFSLQGANFDFYDKLAEVCCKQLECCNFPTFNSSVDDARAAEVLVRTTQESEGSDPLETTNSSRGNPMSSADSPNLTTELSPSCTGGLGQRTAEPPKMLEDAGQKSEIIISVVNEEHEKYVEDSSIIRQASTTEYLPGMLTLASPAGLLPRFSSWSLVCLGPSSLYSHNAGICEQPGFLAGTNFLLPWDVTVKIRDKDKWPAIADSMGKKGFLLKNKKNRLGGDLSEFNVKIFLGAEYQCLRGHRFMMAAPDRHLKASSLGHVKDTAVKIANSDMPLYFPCPCSRSGPVVNGQLMRLHIVTPKAPVNVTLNPVVQPAPDPCSKFVPQQHSEVPMKLSASAYWILRLPFVYVGETDPYYPPDPRQHSSSSHGRLLKGCYGISEITLDR